MKVDIDVEALFDEGIDCFNADEYDEAIRKFSKVLTEDPDHPDAQYYIALAWANKGKSGRAISEFTKAIEKNPNDTDALIGRGEAWQSKGKHKKALVDFKKALSMDPDNPDYKKRVFDLEEN
ncbi:MAG: tetratricopeptide repeat protein [Desulfobacterales bacterium]